jgi:hypothetical protein
MADPPVGLYESLLHQELKEALERRPELRSVFAKIEADEETTRYAAFLVRIVEKALRRRSRSHGVLLIS